MLQQVIKVLLITKPSEVNIPAEKMLLLFLPYQRLKVRMFDTLWPAIVRNHF
jgi:hypothetical protein